MKKKSDIMRLLEKTYIENLVGECEHIFKREHSKENN